LQLQVRCPGTALLVRQYVLMLDLPGVASRTTNAGTTAASAAAMAARTVPASVPAERPARPRRAPASVGSREPIAAGSTYRVQAGDTLSTIAARVGDRGGAGIWQFADQIFAANPGAFIKANPDLIKLGSEIMIPAAAVAATAVAAIPAVATAPEPAPVDASQPVTEVPVPPANDVQAMTAPDDAVQAAVPAPDDDASVAAPAETATAVADTPPAVFLEESPPVAAAVPAVAEPAADAGVDRTSGAPSWLAALIGLMIGAGAAFLLLRERLIDALRRSPPMPLPVAPRSDTVAPASRPAETAPLPVRTNTAREPSMVVVEKAGFDVDEMKLAQSRPGARRAQHAEAPAEPTVIAKPRNDMASRFSNEPDHSPTGTQTTDKLEAVISTELDLDLSAADALITAVDQDIGHATDEPFAPTATDLDDALALPEDDLIDANLHLEQPTIISPDRPGDDTIEQMDLNTMSQRALDDAHLAETLQEALNLLESDYEEEMTGNRRVDRAMLEKRAGDEADDEDDTLARTGTDQMPRPRR
jgi:phage tail protein X